jgi:hypothetical protein
VSLLGRFGVPLGWPIKATLTGDYSSQKGIGAVRVTANFGNKGSRSFTDTISKAYRPIAFFEDSSLDMPVDGEYLITESLEALFSPIDFRRTKPQRVFGEMGVFSLVPSIRVFRLNEAVDINFAIDHSLGSKKSTAEVTIDELLKGDVQIQGRFDASLGEVMRGKLDFQNESDTHRKFQISLEDGTRREFDESEVEVRDYSSLQIDKSVLNECRSTEVLFYETGVWSGVPESIRDFVKVDPESKHFRARLQLVIRDPADGL